MCHTFVVRLVILEILNNLPVLDLFRISSVTRGSYSIYSQRGLETAHIISLSFTLPHSALSDVAQSRFMVLKSVSSLTIVSFSSLKRPSHGKLKLANSCLQTQVGVCVCERHKNRRQTCLQTVSVK